MKNISIKEAEKFFPLLIKKMFHYIFRYLLIGSYELDKTTWNLVQMYRRIVRWKLCRKFFA